MHLVGFIIGILHARICLFSDNTPHIIELFDVITGRITCKSYVDYSSQ